MLYRKLINPCSGLLHRSSARIYIYLRNHNQLINPRDSQLKLSYSRPNNLVPDVPKHNFINFKLDPDMEKIMERQVFEQYKSKVLRGMIDEAKQVEPDPLWGEDAPPTHYYARLSKIQLMSVSHPQNRDFIAIHDALYLQFFASGFAQEVTPEAVEKATLHELVEISLKARKEGQLDGSLFFTIENRYDRGHKLHLLNSDELIKLKYAFDEHQKYGTPIFHEILSSLLREDIPKMNSVQLRNLFHACRHSNPGKTNLQQDCLDALVPHYKNMSFAQKADFLFTFAMSSKPLRLGKKVQKRRRYEFKQLANAFLFRLNIWDLELTHDTVAKMVYSLAKLRFQNTRYLSLPVRDYISNQLDAYCEDKDRLWQAIAYLPELENGEGVADQELMSRLREKAVGRWDQFSKIQKIRMLHSFWNLGLLDEAALELYKGIELESDSTLLYYASQIELAQSSEREWQIIQCLAHLEFIPLPYYIAFRRFYNSIKVSTKWNLTPIAEKLRNTEYYFNVMRLYDSMYGVLTYRQIRQFEEFTKVSMTEKGAPVENLQLAHFAFPAHQVSLDIITPKEYIPGTKQLKQTYLNKVRSLKNIGWKHLAYDEQELRATPAGNIISNIQESYLPYAEEQKTIIDYQDYQRAEEIETVKMLRAIDNWDLKYINKLVSHLEGKQYIELGQGEDNDPVSKLLKPTKTNEDPKLTHLGGAEKKEAKPEGKGKKGKKEKAAE